MAREYSYVGDDVVLDYGEGRLSVEGFLHVCRTYRGPAPHFLLSTHSRTAMGEFVFARPVFFHCLHLVPEDQLCVLLEAVVAERPEVLTLTYPPAAAGGLLHLALQCSTSRRVHLLLAVPGNTRLVDADKTRKTPLHVACFYSLDRVHPDVIQRLIDLDPGVLTLPDSVSRVPLHMALERNPSSPHIQRMIELRPETLLLRDCVGQTPVAQWQPPDLAAPLLRIVAQHPRSVSTTDGELETITPLQHVCENNPPELVRAVLEAYPAALVIPYRRHVHLGEPDFLLPYDGAADSGSEEVAAFVKEETVHLTLAVVEYTLGLNASAVAFDAEAAANVAWFQRRVRDALQEIFPGVPVLKASGLSVVRAIVLWSRDIDECFALVRALFCHELTVNLLRGDGRLLRNSLLCETVVDLYRLNRQGRCRPMVLPLPQNATNDDYSTSSVAAARHQIGLLASLRDSETVESTYLQFREVAYHALIPHGLHRRRLVGPRGGTKPPDPGAGPARKRRRSGT